MTICAAMPALSDATTGGSGRGVGVGDGTGVGAAVAAGDAVGAMVAVTVGAPVALRAAAGSALVPVHAVASRVARIRTASVALILSNNDREDGPARLEACVLCGAAAARGAPLEKGLLLGRMHAAEREPDEPV